MCSHEPPRGLTEEEAEIWARVAKTVTPMHQQRQIAAPPPPANAPAKQTGSAPPRTSARIAPPPPSRPRPIAAPRPQPSLTDNGLDSHWDRRLVKGAGEPDFTLDLHGHTVDSAHRRLDSGLTQAKAMGARMVLVITGKPRPVEAADRGHRRGAIRAKILDWLAAGPHEADIAAIRTAHRKHGGSGALYVVLRRRR